MKKTAFYIVFVLSVICFSAFILSSCRKNDEQINSSESIFQFEKVSDGYSLKKCEGKGKIIVPSEFEGEQITRIGEKAFLLQTEITEVVLPDSVKSIGVLAFESCVNLMKLTLPENLTAIEDSAFQNCRRLVEIYNKSQLALEKESYENGSVAYYALDIYKEPFESKLSTDKQGFVLYKDGDSVKLINYMGNQNKIVFPSIITEINRFAMYNKNQIISVTVPQTIKSIGNYAFYLCDRLVEVCNLSDLKIEKGKSDNGMVAYGAIDVYNNTFNSKLSTDKDGFVVYNDNCKKILVDYIGNMSNVVLPDFVDEIHKTAFGLKDNIFSVVLNANIKNVGETAFIACKNLKWVIIGNINIKMGRNVFINSVNLENIYFMGSIEDWKNLGIMGNNNLNDITINYYSETRPTTEGHYWHYDTDEKTPIKW